MIEPYDRSFEFSFLLFLASFLVIAFLFYIRRFPVFRVFLGILFLLVAASLFFLTGFIFTALVFGVVSILTLIAISIIFNGWNFVGGKGT